MATQPPPTSDTPFGLQPNLAAFLAYFFCLVGGIVMLVGGGTNTFVKWAAAQSIVLWVAYIVVQIVISVVAMFIWPLILPLHFLMLLVRLLALVAWLYTWITALQGKEVRLPIIGDLTTKYFGAQVA